MIAQRPEMSYRAGSMGKPAPGWEVLLHDEDGNDVPNNEVGRIALKVAGGTVPPVGFFSGYADNSEANKEAFINDFYYTGDKARRDEDGFFWFCGRSDDIIKSSGYRISPSEVEYVIMKHTAVHEVAVVGAPDKIRGIVIKAYIVLKPGFAQSDTLAAEIQQHTKSLTAPYKYPRIIEFLEQMPKTYSGKIKRNVLREHALNGGTF